MLYPELSAGGGGDANDDESSPGGGDEVSGKSGWWRILLVLSGLYDAELWTLNLSAFVRRDTARNMINMKLKV